MELLYHDNLPGEKILSFQHLDLHFLEGYRGRGHTSIPHSISHKEESFHEYHTVL